MFSISLHNRCCSLLQESTSDVDGQEANVKGLSKSFYVSFEYQIISRMFVFKVLPRTRIAW